MSHYPLFSVYGIECEYMIVDANTLAVKPIADQLLTTNAKKFKNEVSHGNIAWSNEFALHVIELKTNGPAENLEKLDQAFHQNIQTINTTLAEQGAMLLPTGAHPFFNPEKETVLWPHGDKIIYQTYDRIFGSSGHGWSNLQSTHLNLPFASNSEFVALHQAIRYLLPIIPSLTASTPILDGKLTGLIDTRLKYYGTNQRKLPIISGNIIPEMIQSITDYHEKILEPIYQAIAPYDPQGILQYEWLNSRGAIARFDRNAIEIRIIDIQECPLADLACINLIVAVLKSLVAGKFNDNKAHAHFDQQQLVEIYQLALTKGSSAIINSVPYLSVFNLHAPVSLQQLWQSLYESVKDQIKDSRYQQALECILEEGNLSERIIKSLKATPTHSNLLDTYQHLANCLANNQLLNL